MRKPGLEDGREAVQERKRADEGVPDLRAVVVAIVILDELEHALEQQGLGERQGDDDEAGDGREEEAPRHGGEEGGQEGVAGGFVLALSPQLAEAFSLLLC